MRPLRTFPRRCLKITLKDELEEEIDKWSRKLDERLPELDPVGDSGREILENAKAYREDSEHFREEGELIESFESLIWAWAFVEIGENMGHLSFSGE